jgi:hypothetical protein
MLFPPTDRLLADAASVAYVRFLAMSCRYHRSSGSGVTIVAKQPSSRLKVLETTVHLQFDSQRSLSYPSDDHARHRGGPSSFGTSA